jgi:ABC-type multidrug transport system ATPase subunit
MCSRVLWLDHGRLVADGEPEEIVEAYRKLMRARRKERRGGRARGKGGRGRRRRKRRARQG